MPEKLEILKNIKQKIESLSNDESISPEKLQNMLKGDKDITLSQNQEKIIAFMLLEKIIQLNIDGDLSDDYIEKEMSKINISSNILQEIKSFIQVINLV